MKQRVVKKKKNFLDRKSVFDTDKASVKEVVVIVRRLREISCKLGPVTIGKVT